VNLIVARPLHLTLPPAVTISKLTCSQFKAKFGQSEVSKAGRFAMKAGIHPEYKEAVFIDTSTGHKFLTRTTMTSKETVKWEDGKEYPLVRVDISAYSHPYFTGKMKYVDAAGRVEKFQKKYNWDKRKQAAAGEPPAAK
jgi:large subunit ribosomal protein L31